MAALCLKQYSFANRAARSDGAEVYQDTDTTYLCLAMTAVLEADHREVRLHL